MVATYLSSSADSSGCIGRRGAGVHALQCLRHLSKAQRASPALLAFLQAADTGLEFSIPSPRDMADWKAMAGRGDNTIPQKQMCSTAQTLKPRAEQRGPWGGGPGHCWLPWPLCWRPSWPLPAHTPTAGASAVDCNTAHRSAMLPQASRQRLELLLETFRREA